MKYKNLEVLKKKSIPIYNLYKNFGDMTYKDFSFEKKGSDINIFFGDEKKVCISSVDNKVHESELLVKEVLGGTYDEIIIIGVGNAVFLEDMLKNVDKNRIVHLIEFKEVIDIIFSQVSVKKMALEKINNLAVIDKEFVIDELLSRIFSKTNMKFKIFVLPQYERLFKKEVDQTFEKIKKIINEKKTNIYTNHNYQKLWIYNSIINFKHVISTPNFLDLKNHDFSKSMALLIGAGPSLSFDLDRLKEISDSNTCYIFAIGSAYKSLIKKGVRIDAIFSYDPTELNADVLAEYYEKGVEAPICFGSSIGFKAIRKVNYEKAFHMLTSQDYFGQYLLEGKKSDIINDAPTIAVIALQALAKIGFGSVAFVGQNMAYLDGKNYADGIVYDRLKGKTYESDLKILDVFGNEVSTMKGYVSTRDILQHIIEATPKIDYVNTTYGGADIKGAPYTPLKDMTFDQYEKNIDLLRDCPKNHYQMDKITERFYSVVEDRKVFLQLLNDGILYIYKVKEMLDNNSADEVETLIALQETYNGICKTKYFEILMSKLERNYINIFESSIVEINRERDIYKKYENVYSKMGTLFSLLNKEDKTVFDLFQYITQYINWEEV